MEKVGRSSEQRRLHLLKQDVAAKLFNLKKKEAECEETKRRLIELQNQGNKLNIHFEDKESAFKREEQHGDSVPDKSRCKIRGKTVLSTDGDKDVNITYRNKGDKSCG